MVDTRDLKSLGSDTVPVRVRPRANQPGFRQVFFCSDEILFLCLI